MARPRQVSDEEILDAARACFMEDPNASTVTIADRVGLSQAALFKRFGTKMRLLLEAMGIKHGPPWVDLCAAGPDERPIDEQLVEIGTEVQGFFTRIIPRLMAMKAVGISFQAMFGDHDKPPPVVGFESLEGWFRRAVESGRVRDEDPKAMALAFLGQFQGRAFWKHMAAHLTGPMPPDDAYIAFVVHTFWRGVAPEEGA